MTSLLNKVVIITVAATKILTVFKKRQWAGSAVRPSIILGASSGIGAATALEFAKQGSKLVLAARNVENLNAVGQKCKSNGLPEDKVLVVQCDILKEDNMTNLVDTTVKRFGQIDVLVNNAGSGHYVKFMETSLEILDKIIAVNVRAPFYLTQLCMPHLIKTKGCVVNVSSISGQRSFPGCISYCMAKAALDQFTRTLSVDMATHKVRVNSVNPGVVVTNFQKMAGMSDEAYKKYLERQDEIQPLTGAIDPIEVAKAIKFFASDESSSITGELMFIDGGRHCKAIS